MKYIPSVKFFSAKFIAEVECAFDLIRVLKIWMFLNVMIQKRIFTAELSRTIFAEEAKLVGMYPYVSSNGQLIRLNGKCCANVSKKYRQNLNRSQWTWQLSVRNFVLWTKKLYTLLKFKNTNFYNLNLQDPNGWSMEWYLINLDKTWWSGKGPFVINHKYFLTQIR